MSESDNSRTKRSGSSTPSSPAPDPGPDPIRAVYVHSPFCVRRCPYCDFSIALFTDRVSPARYLQALRLEVRRLSRTHSPRTLYIGGGTPTVLKRADLETFFQVLWERLDRSRLVEFSIEANPENLRADRIACLVDHGVTRVTLGAQSLDPDALRFLGRRHTPDQVVGAVARLRAAGVSAVGVDLIYGLPDQTPGALEQDLERLIRLGCDHVSAYCLTFEPGTRLSEQRQGGLVKPLSNDAELGLYRLVRDRLTDAGYRQYEVSNFAREGARSLHNLTYWRNRPYLGLGPSAVSYRRGIRRKNTPDLAAWCDLLEAGLDPTVEQECLDPDRSLKETVMLALRTVAGIRASTLLRRYGRGFEALDPKVLDHLSEQRLIDRSEHLLRPTPRGLELADGIGAALL
ncbi:MAG: radical SAM family heme chaperone HemW [Planctomycetota bacterium]